MCLRAEAGVDAPVLSAARRGDTLAFDAECDGWLRTARVVADGKRGWAQLRGIDPCPFADCESESEVIKL